MIAVWFCKGDVSYIDWFIAVTDISIVLLNAEVGEVKKKKKKKREYTNIYLLIYKLLL
jgi:hypothetical protein